MSNLTKKAIKDTFLKLLDERPLSQITVKDIVMECGINRNTFYYHYDNIPALIEEVIMADIDRFAATQTSYESLEECFNTSVSFIMENRKAMYHIYKSVSRDVFERYLMEACTHAITQYINSVFADVPMKESDKELIIKYHKCTCFGAVIDWLENGMTNELTEDFHRLFELKSGQTEQMVERSVNSNG